MTTQELLMEWLENYEKERVKPRTYSRYQGILSLHIIPALGEVKITELGRRQIQEFLSQKRKDGNVRNGRQLSARSTNLMLTVLNMAFEYACDMELVDENPCVRLKRAPEDGKKVEAFTKDKQRRLEARIDTDGDRRLFGILLCLYSGLRIGELLGLEWSDVDLENGIITIDKTVYREKDDHGLWQLCVDKPKTKSSERRIPLPSYITERMREYRKSSFSPYVVENKKGERMSIRSYQYMFERLTEKGRCQET